MRRKISDEEKTILKLSCLVHDRLGEYADCSGLIEAFDVAGDGLPTDRVPLCRCHAREAGEAGSVERERFEVTNWIDLREAADRIAVMHSEPVGIRGLATRFAHDDEFDAEHLDAWERNDLDVVEVATLLAWVSREIQREIERRYRLCRNCLGDGRDGEPATGCDPGCAGPCEMCGGEGRTSDRRALEWFDDLGLAPPDDRDALADHIATVLGGHFLADEQGLAWELCRVAGWGRVRKPVTHEWKRVRCVLQSAALAWSRELVEGGWETIAMRDTKLDGSPVPGWQVLAIRPIGGAS